MCPGSTTIREIYNLSVGIVLLLAKYFVVDIFIVDYDISIHIKHVLSYMSTFAC